MVKVNKQEQKIITKVDLNLYSILLHLQDYQENAKHTGDKVLRRLYDELLEYIESRILLQSGDIEDTYVVIEQRINE